MTSYRNNKGRRPSVIPLSSGSPVSRSRGNGALNSTETPEELFARLFGGAPTGSQGQSSPTSKYSDLLGNNANNEWTQFLASLGIQQPGTDRMSSDQIADWNKQLLDAQLNYYQNLEERQYTKGVLDEQRLYDSPTNQLARLLGAGVSRDAAIAMLSGQAGQATLAQGVQPTAGPSASESSLNAQQRKLAGVNAFFNGVGALSGLVSLGFSVPQALAQTAFLKNQNFLTERQNQAYQSAGQAYSILNKIGASAESFGSVSSAAAAINKAAKDGNQDAALFVNNGGLQSMLMNAPFASQTLSSMYNSERHARDYAKSYSNQMRLMEAQSALAEISYDKVFQEILNDKASFDEIWSRINLNDESRYAIYLQNLETESRQNAIDATTGKSGLDLMTANTMYGLVNDFKALSQTQNQEYWDDLAKSIVSEPAKVAAINMLLEWQNSASLEMANAAPSLFRFTQSMKDTGFIEYLDALGANTGQFTESGGVSFGMGLFSTNASSSTPGLTENAATRLHQVANISDEVEKRNEKRKNHK